jgi:hypothetical protein
MVKGLQVSSPWLPIKGHLYQHDSSAVLAGFSFQEKPLSLRSDLSKTNPEKK